MEMQNKQRTRNANNKQVAPEPNKSRVESNNEDGTNKGLPNAGQSYTDGLNQKDVGNNLSVEDMEKERIRQQQEDEEIRQKGLAEKRRSMGFPEEFESSPEFDFAVESYDPARTSPQLAEMWKFNDSDYQRDGRF